MITPPPPVLVPYTPSRCPQCGGVENKKEVCAHCGYEYEEQKISFWWQYLFLLAVIILGVIFVGWFLWTMMEWFHGAGDSLLEVLLHQWRWAKNLRVW